MVSSAAMSCFALASTRVVLSEGKAIVFVEVSQRNPKCVGVLVGSRIVFTQLMDQSQDMKTSAITCMWNIALHPHELDL